MSRKRYQFGLRGLFLLVLAFACFLGGWMSHKGYWASHDRNVQTQLLGLQAQNQNLMQLLEKIQKDTIERPGTLRSENENLRDQIRILEKMVDTLNAEIEEINAVVDRPPSS